MLWLMKDGKRYSRRGRLAATGRSYTDFECRAAIYTKTPQCMLADYLGRSLQLRWLSYLTSPKTELQQRPIRAHITEMQFLRSAHRADLACSGRDGVNARFPHRGLSKTGSYFWSKDRISRRGSKPIAAATSKNSKTSRRLSPPSYLAT